MSRLADDIDIEAFLNARKLVLNEENERLTSANFITNNQSTIQNDRKPVSTLHTNNKQIDASQSEEKENFSSTTDQNQSNELKILLPSSKDSPATKRQNVPLLTKQHLSYVDISKEPAINNLFRSDASNRPAMLRYGDYSPSNLHLNVPAQPHLGFGEYDHQMRRHFIRQQLLNDHKQHLNKKNELIKSTSIKFKKSRFHKAVQTDIQNINNKLIQYSRATNLETNTAEGDLFGLPPTNLTTIESCVMHNNRSPILHRLDQRITAAHNNLLKSEMDKPRGILTNRNQTPRERLLSDLKHSYLPSAGNLYNGYNTYSDRSDQMERERIKREIYQNELRLQIEEKRRLATMREEQERREQDLENKRLEQQLLRMQEEQLRDEQRRNRRELIRRNSDDYASRKQEMQHRFRKHAESESGLGNIRSTTVASKHSSHYSPPVSRRNIGGISSVSSSALPYSSYNVSGPGTSTLYADPKSSRYNPSRYDTYVRKNMLNRMDSINNYVPFESNLSTHNNYGRTNLSSFSRYDSLSRIDSLKQQDALNSRLESLSLNESLSRVQRRHSATQQDLSISRRSPKLQRRSSSSRFDDSLPIPLLKAHSPVARELKYSQAVNSTSRYSSSEALRKLEDRWQVPAVQKNYMNRVNAAVQNPNVGVDGHTNSSSRSVLTQLGAIRMQLQREQMRMDETLKERERASMSHTDTS